MNKTLLNYLYLRELRGARAYQQKRAQNQTFVFVPENIQSEIEHAIKYSTWGMKNA